MTYLILSILASTFILIVFRMFQRYQVDIFQAIVVNYIVAFCVGFIVFGSSWSSAMLETGNWQPFAGLIGILFISLFLLMGRSAQDNGIGTTSVAVKMGLVIPVVAAILLYQESVYLLKIVGVIAALIGVVLITFQAKGGAKKVSGNSWALVILFLGSGLLDTLLNYVEKRSLGDLSPAIFSAIGFGVAAVIGCGILFLRMFQGRIQLRWRNVFGGIILGVPNYFSIYFLIMAIRADMDDSITYAINNVGIVLLSFFLGILFFRESFTRLKIAGVSLAILAIILLVF